MAVLTDVAKYEVVRLDACGKTSRQIAEIMDVGKSTIGDFLRKETYQKWWGEYGTSKSVTISNVSLATESEILAGVDNDKVITPAVINRDFTLKGVWKNHKAFNPDKPVGSVVGPKILTLDIETAPIMASVWRLFDQNVGLNMIEQDWYVLSWAAKWMHEDQVIYEDKSDDWDNEVDIDLLQGIWTLLDEADIIITQNGKKFDAKKLNARFILNGMKPPSSYRHIDTLQEAKRHFGFTSNKLEYMTDKLCKVYKKLTHGDFPGFELWKECLRGNPLAWQEMKDYNIHDVLSLEELYKIMQPWMKTHINMNVYYEGTDLRCKCGHDEFQHNGYAYTNLSKFDRFECTNCGAEVRGRVNLLSKEKRVSLRMNITQ